MAVLPLTRKWASPEPSYLAHIVEDLRPLAVPVAALAQLPDNPHHGDDGAMHANLKRFKQRKPIVVNRRTAAVEAGNTTLRATIAAGHHWIAAVLVDDNPAEQSAFALADNRAAALGWDDQGVIAKLLLEVYDTDATLMHAAGFDDDDLDSIVAEVLRDTNPQLAAILNAAPPLPEQAEHPEPNAAWNPATNTYFPAEADGISKAAEPSHETTSKTTTTTRPGRTAAVNVTFSIAVPPNLRHPLTTRLSALMNTTQTRTMGEALATHFGLEPSD